MSRRRPTAAEETARQLVRRLAFAFVRGNRLIVDFSLYPSSSARPTIKEISPEKGENETPEGEKENGK